MRSKQPRPDDLPLSVVINTYNKGATLEKVLLALERQDHVAHRDFEVVVRDDGSQDDTPTRVARIAPRWQGRLRFSRGVNVGVSEARNLAVRQARGRLILILADDIVASPGLLHEHLQRHSQESGRQCAVIGKVSWPPELDADPFRHWLDNGGPQFAYGEIDDLREVRPQYFAACNVSLSRELLLANPFDPEITYGYEDTELGLRLHRAGVRMLYHPEAHGFHHHPRNFSEFRARQFRVGQSLYAALRNHPELDVIVRTPYFGLRRRIRLTGRWLRYRAACLAGSWIPISSYRQQRYWSMSLYRALYLGYQDALRRDQRPARALAVGSREHEPLPRPTPIEDRSAANT